MFAEILSPFQKRLVSIAISCIALMTIFAFVAITFNFIGAFVSAFSLVIWPLALAMILSVMMKPMTDFLVEKLKVSNAIACIIVFLLIVVFVSAILIFALPKAIGQISDIIAQIPILIEKISEFLSSHFPVFSDKLKEFVESVKSGEISKEMSSTFNVAFSKSLKTLLNSASVAVSLGSAIAAFAVVPIYLFYILTSTRNTFDDIDSNLKFLDKKVRDDIVFLMKQFAGIMSAFFRGQMLIAFILGILLSLGFGFAGVKFGFLLGFLIGIINVVPYLGTIIGLSIILPLSFFQDGGGAVLLGIVIGIFVIVQLFEGYFLTPKIMGDKTGLHPMVIIFSIFFWGTALGGILGMILAIPLTAFFVVLWRLLKEFYLQKLFKS